MLRVRWTRTRPVSSSRRIATTSPRTSISVSAGVRSLALLILIISVFILDLTQVDLLVGSLSLGLFLFLFKIGNFYFSRSILHHFILVDGSRGSTSDPVNCLPLRNVNDIALLSVQMWSRIYHTYLHFGKPPLSHRACSCPTHNHMRSYICQTCSHIRTRHTYSNPGAISTNNGTDNQLGIVVIS